MFRKMSLWASSAWLMAGALVFLALVYPAFSKAAEAVTDTVILNDLQGLVGMFGMGAAGYPVVLAVLAFAMKLTKWGRAKSLFLSVPAAYRSFIPLVLGGVIGAVEALSTGVPWGLAIAKGVIVVGGGQQLLYEASKKTPLGALFAAVTAFVPQPPKKR